MDEGRKILLGLTVLTLGFAAAASAGEPYFPKREKAFQRLDGNKNGQVELAEFTPVIERSFNRMDSNGDKAVSSQELEQRMQQAIAKRRDRIMQLLDRDKNGVITESELDNVVEAMFNSADTDHNGGLSMAEIQGFKRADWRKSMVGQGAN